MNTYTDVPLLFQRYPQLQPRIPWLRLLTASTPVQHMKSLGEKIGNTNLWIKMDDRSGSLYGGNKIRKLEFLLGEAVSSKCASILTAGAYGSNQAVATTLYGKNLGLKVVLLLHPQPLDKDSPGMMNLIVNYTQGADVRLLSSPLIFLREYIRLGLQLLPLAQQNKTYYIPAGASTAIGCMGYVNAAIELHEQIETCQMPPPKAIFLPVGSGGTVAGLQAGFSILGVSYSIIGVTVHPTASSYRAINRKSEKTIELLARHSHEIKRRTSPLSMVNLASGYIGEGYGYSTIDGQNAVRLLLETEGILLEGTYTGKAFAAFLNEARKLRSDAGPLLFWNTSNSISLASYLPQKIDFSAYPPKLRQILGVALTK